MNGKDLRLRRLLPTDGHRLFAVPMDHSLSLGPIPGLEDAARQAAALQEAGATLLIVHKGTSRQVLPILRPGTFLGIHLSASTSMGVAGERKRLTGSVREAVRLGADLVSAQVNFGEPGEGDMLEDLSRLASEAEELGIPLLCMAYVRTRGHENDPAYLAHACRAAADLGADLVKTNFPGPDGFRQMVRTTPVPLLVGGGPRMEDPAQFLAVVGQALDAGARGICVGRNLFQSNDLPGLGQDLRRLLHARGGEH
jgi:DhnA family fructose-bisphosphate aldolase class Ia